MQQTRTLSLAYLSTATDLFDKDDLSAILTSSRRNNALTHLTGMLLHREGRFLQVLEGPETFVRERMTVIAADPRHTDIRVLLEEEIRERRFPQWTMKPETLDTGTSDENPGIRRMMTDIERDDDRAGAIRALKMLVRWFEERAQSPG